MSFHKTLNELCFDNTVSLTTILSIAGQGDWELLESEHEELFEDILDMSTNQHPTVLALLDSLPVDLDDINAETLLEELLEAKALGFFVTLSTPIPRNFTTLDVNPNENSSWGWSSSQGMRTSTTVYVETFEDLLPIIPAFKEEVVKRELARHLAKKKAA